MTLQSVSNGPSVINLNPCVIATHGGVFHADDVLAVAMLGLLCSLHDVTVNIVRTRDPAKLADADVVVDVGGEYDAERRRYDHHQKGRAGSRENGVLFSSFGLVWRDYGRDLCAALGAGDHAAAVAEAVDTALVAAIDAVDNGQDLYVGGAPAFEGVRGASLSAALSGYNPSWQDDCQDFDAAFARAVAIAQDILRNEVRSALGVELAKAVVDAAAEAAADPRVIVLDKFCPWTDRVREHHVDARFVVYPSEAGTWMVQTIPAAAQGFAARMDLPAAWAGLRGSAFAEIVGIADAVFAHPGRFICGFETRASAEKAAQLALL